MTTAIMVLFGALTLGALGLSSSNLGAPGASVDKAVPSVRSGSSGSGFFVGSGGSRGGK